MARDPLARASRKPNPTDWADDDQMTLKEAVAVFWPDGPLTRASLRTAIAGGQLQAAKVAGKTFVTPAGLRAMFKPKASPAPAAAIVAAERLSAAQAKARATLDALRKMPRRS